MARRAYRGGANTLTLLSGMSDVIASATTGPTSPVGWADGSDGEFAVTINKGTPLGGIEEKVLVHARTGGVFTITQRGYDGTVPGAHSPGETWEMTVTAVDLDEANAHVNASTGVHGLNPGDRVVGNVTPATLVDKTIDGGSNVLTNIPRAASPQIDADLTTLTNAVNAEAGARAAADALLAPKASPTFTGTVILPNTGGGANEAATKAYADSAAAAAAAPKAPIASPTFTGTVTLPGDAASALQATTKQQMDAGLALKLALAGGTMTGDLVLNDDTPDTSHSATSKSYVDTLAAAKGGKGGTVTLSPDGNGNIVIPHGLGVTPDHEVFAAVGPSTNGTWAGIFTCNLRTKDATNLTCHVFHTTDGTPVSSGGVTVTWHAWA